MIKERTNGVVGLCIVDVCGVHPSVFDGFFEVSTYLRIRTNGEVRM